MTPEQAREAFEYDGSDLRWRVGRRNAGQLVGSVLPGRGYRRVDFNGRSYFVHRVIWLWVYGEWPNGYIDHIDGDTSNNKLSNLRVVTTQENGQNRKLGKNNKSGVVGVDWSARKRKWCARIKVGEQRKYIGYFDDINAAAAARKNAERVYGYHENHGRS